MAVRKRKSYSSEFKANALGLVLTIGRARAAKHLGISEGALKNWEAKKGEEKKLTAEEQAEADRKELIALRKENAEQKQIIHILKRAAAVFSADQLK